MIAIPQLNAQHGTAIMLAACQQPPRSKPQLQPQQQLLFTQLMPLLKQQTHAIPNH